MTRKKTRDRNQSPKEKEREESLEFMKRSL